MWLYTTLGKHKNLISMQTIAPPNSTMNNEPKQDLPRGSIRDLEHSWQVDARTSASSSTKKGIAAPPPIAEIQRIQRKTQQLRSQRVPGSARPHAATPDSGSQEDSLNDVLGSMDAQDPRLRISPAAVRAEAQLLHGFRQPRQGEDEEDATVNTSSESGPIDPNLALHDLCGEAISTDDIAWRNALTLLSSQPHLASMTDPSPIWTPLHICCLGMLPPPTYMIRALLHIYPKATTLPDEGGRLVLHLLAASSADTEIMQLVLDANPTAIYHRDHHGYTPLHLLLRNRSVDLTLDQLDVLLGRTIATAAATSSSSPRHVLQRRGDHLRMSLRSVDEWVAQRNRRPVTQVHHNAMAQEPDWNQYPPDVQVCLRKLSQWKYLHHSKEEEESVEVQWSSEEDGEVETNPAAIPLPNETQWPIHMLVQRLIVDAAESTESSEVKISEEEDEDDEEMTPSVKERRSVNETIHMLRVVANAWPEALGMRDEHGSTPLLQAMQLRDSFPSAELVQVLLGPLEAGPDWAQDLPTESSHPARIPDRETRQLPLHIAAEEAATDVALIRTLVDCYPAAVHVQDGHGRTPLHLAFHSYRRVSPDPQVLELLFSERVALTVDDYGRRPLDRFLEHAQILPLRKPRSTDIEGTSIYQKLLNASILGSARPTTPPQVDDFLQRLRSLPPWLRAKACSTTVVQDMLTYKVTSPWKCASILLDGFALFALIIVFRLQMKEFVDQLYEDRLLSSWYTYLVYATAIVRFFARLVFGFQAATIGEFRHLCLYNIWYWIDIWAMFMSIVTSIVLYGSTSDERLLVLGTASTILLWLSLLGYLSSWCYSMAVFTGGFLKISHFILSPLLTAGVLVVAFAQCFYTLLQLDCSDALATSPVCSVRDSYRIVYRLLRGESLVDPSGLNPFSSEAIVLLTSFFVLLAMFLIALLLTIFLGAAQLDLDQIALHSYWEPLLGFILSTGDFVKEHPSPSKSSWEVEKAHLWDVLTQSLNGNEPTKGSSWFASPFRYRVLTQVVALFIVPLWILAGFLSLGLLWPPQVRLWLFRPTLHGNHRNSRMLSERTRPQISEMRKELLQLKSMSYDRSNELEKELREIKELLLLAIQE